MDYSGDAVFEAGRGQRVEILYNGNDHYDALAPAICMPIQPAQSVLGSHTEDPSHGNPTFKSAEGTLGEMPFNLGEIIDCDESHSVQDVSDSESECLHEETQSEDWGSGGPLRAANLILWGILAILFTNKV